jgi:hypothetical protein
MLDNSNAHIWCIDHWRGSRPGAGHGLVASDDDFMVFLKNIEDARDRITILKMSTREAAVILPEGCFDMVFIDADHRYDAVRFDIAHYARLLRRGGLLCGHDARAGWRGVDRAIEELITHPREGGKAIWWAVKEPGWMTETERENLNAPCYTVMATRKRRSQWRPTTARNFWRNY